VFWITSLIRYRGCSGFTTRCEKFVEKKLRDFVAVNETVVKMHGLRVYVWSSVDVNYGEILAI
jgi:transposase-like protein